MLCEGVVGVVAAMRSYPAQRSLLPWQDMFVDLVQGRLQNLFLSLLACETGPLPALLGGFCSAAKLAAACVAMCEGPCRRAAAEAVRLYQAGLTASA